MTILLLTSCKTTGSDGHIAHKESGYGLSLRNPVKLGSRDEFGGPEAERIFLWHLEDEAARRYRWTREGDVGPGPDGHIVDVFSSNEAGSTKIYIDMYHPNIHPFKATPPEGFRLRF
jgi:hypothetical protein